jgi:hypothetical protein
MSTYFTLFPTIEYDHVNVRDITRRSDFVTSVLSNPYVFLPYTVKDGEKPEDIAHNYYGTVAATWIVLLANNIVDPYTQWPMDSETFTNYLIEKYQQQSGKTGYDVVAWTQDQTTIDNILYYYTVTVDNQIIKVSPDTFPLLYNEQGDITGRDVPIDWLPERIYDYEFIANEQNRDILVIEKKYYEQIVAEFTRLINL